MRARLLFQLSHPAAIACISTKLLRYLVNTPTTLERAVDAGAIYAYLTFNHRAYAYLSVLPSELIYRGVMGPYRGGQAQYPNSVKSFNEFLEKIVPNLPGHEGKG